MATEKDFESRYIAINKANWDSRVALHLQGYKLEDFRANPDYISDVVRFDLERLGDVRGLRGIHFQCHIGTDTISLSRLGAEMTGLDFSPKSVSAANALSQELGSKTRFYEAEVYEAAESLGAQGVKLDFDFLYTGVGALCWLPDVDKWAESVASVLRPGGFLFIREAHPVMWTLAQHHEDGAIALEYDYFEGPGLLLEVDETYAGDGKVPSPASVSFNHSLSAIFNALWKHGFQIELFQEHNSVPWKPWDEDFEQVEGIDEFRLKKNPNRLPASYSLRAVYFPGR